MTSSSTCNDALPLRVCIEARFAGSQTGNQLTVVGLASGLAQLADGDEEYVFLANEDAAGLLRRHMHGPCRLSQVSRPPAGPAWKRVARKIPGLVAARRKLWARREPDLPVSDGVAESSGASVVHLPFQDAYLTELPSVYTPHDLQHLHYPEYFTGEQLRVRELRYRTFCQQAEVVHAMTQWGKEDLVRNYALPPEKICVIPWASLLDVYPEAGEKETSAVREKFALPKDFIFFPGYTWPHKNHLELFRALAMLRDQYGLVVPLVCSGHRNDFFAVLEREIDHLRLRDQVRFTGYVGDSGVAALYRLCRLLVFPSKFEGWGLPVTEAMAAGVPVACSRIRPLQDLVGTAALLFDPDKPAEIADSVRRLWNDTGLRASLTEAGRQRASQFSWERTARMFRAQYRRIGGRSLGEDDREILASLALV